MHRVGKGRSFIFAYIAALTLLSLTLSAGPAVSATTCTDTADAAARAVCGNAELQALHMMAEQEYTTYAKRRQQFKAPMSEVPEPHKQWLANRTSCGGDRNCLWQAYVDRLARLNARLIVFDARANEPIISTIEMANDRQCGPDLEAMGDDSCAHWTNPEARLRAVIVGERMAFSYFSAFANAQQCQVEGMANRHGKGWRFKGTECIADIWLTSKGIDIESVSRCTFYCGERQYIEAHFDF